MMKLKVFCTQAKRCKTKKSRTGRHKKQDFSQVSGPRLRKFLHAAIHGRHPPRRQPAVREQKYKKSAAVSTLVTDNGGLYQKRAATYSPACAVPSARTGLTALFGMGRGGTPAL